MRTFKITFSSVQLLSLVRLFLMPWTSAHQASGPSPTPGVYSNSSPLSRWCPTTISSSVVPFFFHLQSFPASGSSQMSQLFTPGGQSIGVSASTSVLPMNTQDWSPLGWTGWSPCSPRDSQESSPHHSSKASILWHSTFFIVPTITSIHDHRKNHSLD